MPPISQGQIFPSLQDFKNALRDWAIERNWTPHILDSDSHRVRAGCRSSADCPFRIRANFSVKRGDAKVTTCDDIHTCEPSRANATDGKAHQPIKRAETGKLRFLLEAVPKLMDVNLDTHVAEIIEAVERKYGQKIPTRQAQKVKANLTDRVKGPCRHCHLLGHTRRHCPQLRGSARRAVNFTQMEGMPQEQGQYADEDQDDTGTYADGGLEMEDREERSRDSMIYTNDDRHDEQATAGPAFTHEQTQPAPTRTFAQPYQNGTVDPNVDPTLAARLHRLNSGEPPVPVQPAVPTTQASAPGPVTAQTQQPSMTRTEVTMEASRMMQQAAQLMQDAAKLNADAARLIASVANG